MSQIYDFYFCYLLVCLSVLRFATLTANGSRLGVVGAFQHKTSYEAESSNLAQIFIRRTSAPHYAKPLLPAVFFVRAQLFVLFLFVPKMFHRAIPQSAFLDIHLLPLSKFQHFEYLNYWLARPK